MSIVKHHPIIESCCSSSLDVMSLQQNLHRQAASLQAHSRCERALCWCMECRWLYHGMVLLLLTQHAQCNMCGAASRGPFVGFRGPTGCICGGAQPA